jgi:Cu2+-exporting ATPase
MMEKRIFQVTGMSCAGCALSVETILKSQNGVKDAGVNFASSTVWVEYDPKTISEESLRDAVRSIGYDLIIEEPDEGANLNEDTAQKLRKRFIYSMIFSLPIIVLQMFFFTWKFTPWIALVLSTPVVFWFGRQFHIIALKQIRHFSTNMDTLISVSTTISYFYSLFAVLFSNYLASKGVELHLYFESAAMIITFVLLGKWLEEKAKGKTSSAIKKIMGLQPQTALVKENGEFVEKHLSQIVIGSVIMVKPGERIPVDGTVQNGHSWVDESSITGEPIPVEKSAGKKVWAGTMNQNGVIHIVAEQIGSASVLGKIIKAVNEAQNSKPKVQKLADKAASIFVPIIIIIAIATFAIWATVAPDMAFTHGLIAAIAVLAIACPCALGLATPTAIMVGIGKAAQKNILIRDADSLELSCKINTVVFDKTGTLTEGRPEVTLINWYSNDDIHHSILKKIEQHSNHPLATAIFNYINADISSFTLDNIIEKPGKGIEASYNGKIYRVGSLSYLKDNGIVSNEPETLNKYNGTAIGFSENNNLLAIIIISDRLKESARSSILALKQKGVEIVMLSGDSSESVDIIAKELGIDTYQKGMLPNEKSKYINQLREQGKVVAMVGDGINDTEALSLADISIAMGKGTDIAMDASQVTIMKNDLIAVAELIEISRQTVRTIKQNLFWASIYNLISIPIAAGVLYPFTGLLLDPMIAAMAMAFSSVSVVSNSLILKSKKITL